MSGPLDKLPEADQVRIRAVCDRFDSEWRSGRAPDVAAYLAAAPDADRDLLRGEFARIEVENRRKPVAAPDLPDGARVQLTITAGPHLGKAYAFDGRDTFLVGRTKDSHFRLSYDDPYFSRRHFLIEVNPPRVRVLDLKSRNGIRVNGTKVETAELVDGDEIKAGHTTFKVGVPQPDPERQGTLQLPHDGATDPFPCHTATGDFRPNVPRVPGYELGAELGRGGMGVVYRAVRSSDGLEVAVKSIIPAAGVSDKQINRFVREAEILRKLRHPNVVAFHHVGESEGLIYLVMELVPGPTADAVVKEKGPLAPPLAVRLTCQLLTALGHAHARGFVHRDVKPANVLIGQVKGKRAVKLADFGLARVYEASRLSGLTMQGDVGGTPAFMAPEQVTHFREAKPAADQYAAAATLYRLLTGHYVHDRQRTAAQQLIHILTEPPVPIQSRWPDVPAGLGEAIHKALSREPEDRFADVSAFRQALLPFG